MLAIDGIYFYHSAGLGAYDNDLTIGGIYLSLVVGDVFNVFIAVFPYDVLEPSPILMVLVCGYRADGNV